MTPTNSIFNRCNLVSQLIRRNVGNGILKQINTHNHRFFAYSTTQHPILYRLLYLFEFHFPNQLASPSASVLTILRKGIKSDS